MKIAILGTEESQITMGFEQFAQYLGLILSEKSHNITIYNSSEHPYKKKFYKINII